ncbi:hypothetical protein D9613_008598 [Agrocybe pediades]|uniref:Uncharacterized protein n=1 Tax=Agrocybe pediades TaxID=84607 RepID=A0A8H4QTB8_9AGAR|nr:hypothetical protein D9613_008598 [Agrocybe pediades]
MSSDPVIAGELITLRNRFIECWVFSNILGAVAYGISLTVSWNCLQLLFSESSSERTTAPMRRILIAFVVSMCVLGTTSLSFAAGGVVEWASNPDMQIAEKLLDGVLGKPFSLAELDLIVLTTWFSDGFMVWRCYKIYSDGVSRKIRFVVYTSLTLISMTSVGLGMCALLTPLDIIQDWSRYQILTSFEIACLGVNAIVSSLVVLRIALHHRYIRKAFGGRNGSAAPYTRVVTICIESASLTLAVSLLHVILASTAGRYSVVGSPQSMIAIKLLVQVNCISPVLIILRVAQGRVWRNTRSSSILPVSTGAGPDKALNGLPHVAYKTSSGTMSSETVTNSYQGKANA